MKKLAADVIKHLLESIPELNGVFDITDHSEGDSPFYKD